MTQRHPITPPEDLLQQLRRDTGSWLGQITIAYQAGADMELEACCEWLAFETPEPYINALRAARRPRPPSLKEQALAALDDAVIRGDCITTSSAVDTIRRALEALDD